VIEMGRNDPPADAAEGDRYIVGPSPTGAWWNKAGQLAIMVNHGWWCRPPKPGWRVYDLAQDTLYVLTTSLTWVPIAGSGGIAAIQNATAIGLGMTADPANPFAAKLNSALWTAKTTAEGGTDDLYMTCNKTDATADAGFAFQSGFVTRATVGLFGSNRFRVAVSPDGTAFNDALSVDEATGIVDQPRLPRFKANTNFDNFAAANTWIKIAINTAESNNQGAFDPATNRFTAPVAGDYCLGASLLFRQDVSTNARLRGRIMKNGSAVIPGSYGENSAPHLSLATALWIQTVAPLAAGDTIELQGSFRAESGYFAGTHTSFWGFKVG
jgi:hypothetical protein